MCTRRDSQAPAPTGHTHRADVTAGPSAVSAGPSPGLSSQLESAPCGGRRTGRSRKDRGLRWVQTPCASPGGSGSSLSRRSPGERVEERSQWGRGRQAELHPPGSRKAPEADRPGPEPLYGLVEAPHARGRHGCQGRAQTNRPPPRHLPTWHLQPPLPATGPRGRRCTGERDGTGQRRPAAQGDRAGSGGAGASVGVCGRVRQRV